MSRASLRPWHERALPPDDVWMQGTAPWPVLEGFCREDLERADGVQPPQHHLVLGKRGVGKTAFLRRASRTFEVHSSAVRWRTVLVPPPRACDVTWARLFGQALANLSHTEMRNVSVEELLQHVPDAEGLCLLVDDFDDWLSQSTDTDWALREVLSAEPRLSIVATATRADASFWSYDSAFYDFFRLHELPTWTLERARDVWSRRPYATKTLEQKAAAFGTSETFRLLNDRLAGNPRAHAVLGWGWSQMPGASADELFETVLDALHPLYQAMVERLAAQSRQVLEGLLEHDRPRLAAELAEDLAIDRNAVATQLGRLTQQGLVEKRAVEGSKKVAYAVIDRTLVAWFRWWRGMRAGAGERH